MVCGYDEDFQGAPRIIIKLDYWLLGTVFRLEV
jgi:hypothetical protein